MSETAPEAVAPAPVEQAPAPAVEPAEAPAAPAAKDPWDDPAAARAEIEKLRKENASTRVNAKQTAAEEAKNQYAQEIGKLLGLVKDDAPATPENLTQQLTEAQAT